MSTQLSVVGKLANQLSIDKETLISTVKNTVFKKATDAQLMVFFSVCDQLNFNPMLKLVWAYPDKEGGVQTLISYSGWIQLANNHPQFDGEETTFVLDEQTQKPISATCVIWRKDRSHPTIVTVYLKEWYKGSNPNWVDRPIHMLGIRAYVQAVRKAFGYHQYEYDPEAEDAIKKDIIDVTNESKSDIDKLSSVVTPKPEAKSEPQEIKEEPTQTLKSDNLDEVEPVKEKPKRGKAKQQEAIKEMMPEVASDSTEFNAPAEEAQKADDSDEYKDLLNEVKQEYELRKHHENIPEGQRDVCERIFINGEYIEKYCNIEELNKIKAWLIKSFEPLQQEVATDDAELAEFMGNW